MTTIADTIPGYDFGTPATSTSPVSLAELVQLKITVGFTPDDERYLRLAGEVLTGQTRPVVLHWRSQIIAHIPNLARHSRALDGTPLPDYLAASNLRFEQWILDTCLRPYDQAWLDYQQEIALRHTSAKKNHTDGVASTPLRPAARHHRLRGGPERHHPAVPRRQGARRRRRGGHAPRVVPLHPAADRALGEGVRA